MPTEERSKAPEHLNARHENSHDAMSRHPRSHNLESHGVLSLDFVQTDVIEERFGILQVAKDGQEITVQTHECKEAGSIEAILAIRHFLKKLSEMSIASAVADGLDMIVVLDHQEWKIHRTELRRAVPEPIRTHEPEGFGLHSWPEVSESRGKPEPEWKRLDEAIAVRLHGEEPLMISGGSFGKCSETEHVLSDMNQPRHEEDSHIIGSFVVDDHHLCEVRLFTRAKDTSESLLPTAQPATEFSTGERAIS